MQQQLFGSDAREPHKSSGSGSVGLPHSGTDTSREAAQSMTLVAAANTARVLLFIADQGENGATDFEVQAALNMTGDSELPRRWELQRHGLVRDSGSRRKSPSGRNAIVYVATERAFEFRRKPTAQAS